MKLKLIILIAAISILLSCWKRQQHDITRPVVPHYLFTGVTVNYDTGEAMPGTKVRLTEVHMLYDVKFGEQIIESDSLGNFVFDPVYPGAYTFSFNVDSYWLFNTKIQIGHKDTTTILKIPQIYTCSVFNTMNTLHPALACKGTTLACNEFWNGAKGNKSPFIVSDLLRFYKSEQNTWTFTTYSISPFYKKNLSSMTYIRSGLLGAIAPDSLYTLNTTDYTTESKIKVPYNISGVAFNGSTGLLYSCSQNTIRIHDSADFNKITANKTFDANNLRSMAFYKNLYSFDNDKSLLFLHDSDLNVQTTFALILNSGKQIMQVYDMTFDGYSTLWITQ